MKEIFLLLWLADVSSTLTLLLIVGCMLSTLALLFATLESAITDGYKSPRKKLLAVLIVMAVVAALLPSRQTLTVAAAARAAQLASKTELGQLAEQAVKEAIRKSTQNNETHK